MHAEIRTLTLMSLQQVLLPAAPCLSSLRYFLFKEMSFDDSLLVVGFRQYSLSP